MMFGKFESLIWKKKSNMGPCKGRGNLQYREGGYDRRLKGGAEKLPRHCTRAYTTYIPRLLRANSMQGTPG